MIWTKVKDRMPAIGELIVFDSIFVDRLTVLEMKKKYGQAFVVKNGVTEDCIMDCENILNNP